MESTGLNVKPHFILEKKFGKNARYGGIVKKKIFSRPLKNVPRNTNMKAKIGPDNPYVEYCIHDAQYEQYYSQIKGKRE